MNSKKIALLLALLLAIGSLSGCDGEKTGPDPQNPLTVTLWHNYGGQMQQTMDELIDEFNMTVGREKGVIVSVTSISAMKEQEERLKMIAAGDPGAEDMPDIVTAYPKTAMLLSQQGLLAVLDDYFNQDELAAFVPQFIEEGRLPDGSLYVFPIAKSTEVLFVNETLFDRFSDATGITPDSLDTFEGIAEASVKYFQWTDSLTPETPDDGKTLFTADSWFNIAQAGMAQMGSTFVEPDKLSTDLPQFERIWEASLLPALSGGFAVTDGYSSELSKTGDIVCSIGSTAGILFYGDSITYSDNTIEEVTFRILPYPVFNGGEKIAIQRGAGMIVASSTPAKEYAASLFLKWFTSPEQNLRFISSTGYLPVTDEAFTQIMSDTAPVTENLNVRKLLETAVKMHSEYLFMTAPNYETFDAMSRSYEANIKEAMREGRQRVQRGEITSEVMEALMADFID